MKFAKPFYGVPAGAIYPIQYEAGADCPPELLDAAKSVGAVDTTETTTPPVADETTGPLAPPAGVDTVEATALLQVADEVKPKGKNKDVPDA